MEGNGIVRRRIVRRRGNGNATGTGANGNPGDGGTNNTSTIGSRNGDNAVGIASDGESVSGQDSRNSDTDTREIGIGGSESERDRNSGGSGSSERNDDGTIQFDTGSGSARTRNSRSAATGSGEGKPKRVYRRKQKPQDAVLLAQDEEDLVNIVVAVGDGLSNATSFEGFQISKPEAGTIARPAARILQRHGALAETIRSVADPFALIVATATVFGPRIAGYKMYRQMQFANVPSPQPYNGNDARAETSDDGVPNDGKVINFKDVNFAQNEAFNR